MVSTKNFDRIITELPSSSLWSSTPDDVLRRALMVGLGLLSKGGPELTSSLLIKVVNGKMNYLKRVQGG